MKFDLSIITFREGFWGGRDWDSIQCSSSARAIMVKLIMMMIMVERKRRTLWDLLLGDPWLVCKQLLLLWPDKPLLGVVPLRREPLPREAVVVAAATKAENGPSGRGRRVQGGDPLCESDWVHSFSPLLGCGAWHWKWPDKLRGLLEVELAEWVYYIKGLQWRRRLLKNHQHPNNYRQKLDHLGKNADKQESKERWKRRDEIKGWNFTVHEVQ